MGYLTVLTEARSVMATGSYDAAEKAQQMLMRFAESCEDSVQKGMALRAAADVSFRQGKALAAIDLYREAEQHLTDATELLKLYASWAILADEHGIPDHTSYLIQQLCALLANYEETDSAAVYGYLALARMYVRSKRLDDAVAAAQEAVRLADAVGLAQAEAYSALSKVHEACDRLPEAMEALEHAMLHMGEGHCLMQAMAEYGRLALCMGDRKTATLYIMRAVELPDLRDRQVIANVLRTVAQLVRDDPLVAADIIERLAAHLGNCDVRR